MVEKIRVNPKETKDGHLVVHDELGRIIPFKEDGNMTRRTTHISRRVKDGDLVDLDEEKKKKLKPKQKENKKDKEN